MDTGSTIKQAPPAPRRITTSVRFAQWCIGFSMNVLLALPYLRRTHGMAKLDSRRRYIFVHGHARCTIPPTPEHSAMSSTAVCSAHNGHRPRSRCQGAKDHNAGGERESSHSGTSSCLADRVEQSVALGCLFANMPHIRYHPRWCMLV